MAQDMADDPSEDVTLDQTTADKANPLRLSSGRAYKIQVKVFTVNIKIFCDPDNPDATDDSATLESTDGTYRKTVQWSEGKKVENGVILKFRKVKPDKSYNLLVDPGSEGEPFFAFKNVQATAELLKKHMAV